MARSIWKGPFVDGYLLKKADASRGTGRSEVIKIRSRRSTILPQFVGLTFGVHNGHKHIPVNVSEDMIGHKFGEFAPTGTFHGHAADKKVEERLKAMSKPNNPPRLRGKRGQSRCAHALRVAAKAQSSGATDPRQEGRSALWPICSFRASVARSTLRRRSRARSPTPKITTVSTFPPGCRAGVRRQGAGHEAFPCESARSRQSRRKALLEIHHHRARSSSAGTGLKERPMGQEGQSDRAAPWRQPHLGLALVRVQGRIRQTLARRHRHSRSHHEGAEAGGGVAHRHRTPAQEVPRHDLFGASGRRDRQKGRGYR